MEVNTPNIVLLTIDCLRIDHLGCYGYPFNTSANIDRLASESVKFSRAVSQSGATPISHASIFTGLNPYQHGVRVIYAASGYKLPESIPTLATVLANHGWQSAAFLSSFTVSEFYGLDQGFETFDSGMKGKLDSKMKPDSNGKWSWSLQKNQRRSDETTDAAVSWLEKKRKSDRSFFLWVHYWDPHDQALTPPDETVERFIEEARQKIQETSISTRPDIYDAEVYYMDSQFGRLIQTLKETGQYDNSIIVVIADHGQGLEDGEKRHGWYFHRLLYQEQIHLPLIIRLPDGDGGTVVNELVRSIDIFPTVLEVLGLEGPKFVEGRSLIGLINNKPEPSRVAYADAINLYDLNAGITLKRPKDGLLYCVTDGSWKLIYRPELADESELYNLAADPLEMNNLYTQQPEQVERLRKILDDFDGYVDKPFGEGADPAVVEKLKSLGYVGEEP